MKLDDTQQVEAIAQTLAEALRQRMGPDELEAALDFVSAYTAFAGKEISPGSRESSAEGAGTR